MQPLSADECRFFYLKRLVTEYIPPVLRQLFVLRWDERHPDDKWDIDCGKKLLNGVDNIIEVPSCTMKLTEVHEVMRKPKGYAKDIPHLMATIMIEEDTVPPINLYKYAKNGVVVNVVQEDGSSVLPPGSTVDKIVSSRQLVVVTPNVTNPLPQERGSLRLRTQRVLPPANLKDVANDDAQKKILNLGLICWDVSLCFWALTDAGRRLVDSPTDTGVYPLKPNDKRLYEALKAVKDIRNKKYGHSDGCVDEKSWTEVEKEVLKLCEVLDGEFAKILPERAADGKTLAKLRTLVTRDHADAMYHIKFYEQSALEQQRVLESVVRETESDLEARTSEMRSMQQSNSDGAGSEEATLQDVMKAMQEELMEANTVHELATRVGCQVETLTAKINQSNQYLVDSVNTLLQGQASLLEGQKRQEEGQALQLEGQRLQEDRLQQIQQQNMQMLQMLASLQMRGVLSLTAQPAASSSTHVDFLFVVCSPNVSPLPQTSIEAHVNAKCVELAGLSALVHSNGKLTELNTIILHWQPRVIVFAGHADAPHPSSKRTLGLTDASGKLIIMEPDTIARIFAEPSKRLELISLNGCRSSELCEAITRRFSLPTCGWSSRTADEAAKVHSLGLVDALVQSMKAKPAAGRLENDDLHAAFQHAERSVLAVFSGGTSKWALVDPDDGCIGGKTPDGKWAAGVPVLKGLVRQKIQQPRYWLEVAIQVPPAVFDASARDRAAVARLMTRLERDLKESEAEMLNLGHYPICITDAAHKKLGYDLEAGDVNILVLCGLGCDVRDCAGSEKAFNLKELEAKLRARDKPWLVVVCMKYGARQIAEKLKGVCWAAIVWVEADVMSQNCTPEKPLLAAVLDEVSSNLARSGSADGLIKEVEAAGGTAGMIVQAHETSSRWTSWIKALPNSQTKVIVPRVSRLPDTKTNIFTSLSGEELQLLACDISRTEKLHREIKNAVSKDKCPLKRCISSKETEGIITDKEAAQAARCRMRAVAFHTCNAFIHDGDGDHNGTFHAVYRIHTDDTKETREGTLKTLSDSLVKNALIWLDLEEEAEDDLLKEINSLMRRFSRDGKKGVFLLTPTPTHLPKMSFDVFQMESIDAIGGGKYKASDLYEEITFQVKRGKRPVNILEELKPEEFAKILKNILEELVYGKSTAAASFSSSSSPSLLAGLYHGNAEHGGEVVARFFMSSVGFLHQLRDWVFFGSLVKRLQNQLGEALQVSGRNVPLSLRAKPWNPIDMFRLAIRRVVAGEQKQQAPLAAQAEAPPPGHQRLIGDALEQLQVEMALTASQRSDQLPDTLAYRSVSADNQLTIADDQLTISVDLSLFADVYESSILQLDQLTPHQEEKMGEALRLLRGDDKKRIVHLTAPAGAGKTFVAHKIVLDLLEQDPRDGIVLYSARSVSLCLFFVKWLVKRCLSSRYEDEKMIEAILERVQVLHAPYEQGPLAIKLNEEKGDIEFVSVPEGGKARATLLVVEDEAHHTYGDPELKLQVEKQIKRWAPCHRLLLSDESQSHGTHIEYPNGMEVVELTEVVRCSKRIITASNDFARCGTKEKVPTCHHASEGPPLQSFLFDVQQDDESRRDELYAEQTIAALQSVVTQFERLPLHDRLAIIVPDEGMRAKLLEKLKARLAAAFPSRSFELVGAQRASRTYKKGVGKSEWLVLDTIDSMDGLERLIVIAVGLDSPIPENAGAAGAAAAGDVLRARSRLYRALSRAHMLVCVVNETLPRGWLAYLTRLKLDEKAEFDEAAAARERKAVEESSANSEKLVTTCKEEAKAAVVALVKAMYHSLGKEAVEWCSEKAAKKLFAGGAAKAAADAVCEWLIKPEMEAVEKMAAGRERGLEAAEARAAVVRCVRSKLLESIARAPLKGGEGEVALAAVLVQWRRIGEELGNALAAREGLEGVSATEMIRMQEAVMAVVAEGGELKAAVAAEVQEAKRRWEQMKEAAVHRAREEKLMAERKAKVEKLRVEVVWPAMAALLTEAEELDKVACDWICAYAVKQMVAGAGGSEVDGKMAVRAAVAEWAQRRMQLEASRQGQTEQSVWDTKANQTGVVGGVLAFDPLQARPAPGERMSLLDPGTYYRPDAEVLPLITPAAARATNEVRRISHATRSGQRHSVAKRSTGRGRAAWGGGGAAVRLRTFAIARAPPASTLSLTSAPPTSSLTHLLSWLLCTTHRKGPRPFTWPLGTAHRWRW